MLDNVELSIGDQRISNFKSYEITADIFAAASAFSIDLSNPELSIPKASLCKILINGKVELTGIIDSVERSYEKRNKTLRIAGRDLMGLLVDSSCMPSADGTFPSFENVTVLEAARQLIKDLPFIQRKNIQMQQGCKERAIVHKAILVEPGMTRFQVLSRYAAMRGLLFYSLPDGSFVFGEPKKIHGKGGFVLVNSRDGINNNVISGRHQFDQSQTFSQITVVSQSSDGEAVDSSYTTSVSHPFFKPLVLTQNGDDESPSSFAKFAKDKMKRDANVYEYVVPGHSQNGRNWSINEGCKVLDDDLGINGSLLVCARTFVRNRSEGTTTRLRLGPGGDQ
jgi:prophage tail gpP-like protein